ncbi:potassium voltage-gated channel protein Shaw-like [Rhizophagus clarus]|uniref:Potassium voltage-gated channel protein Shaw-like n=1 Tax=Rhizophagus clarus TaxID=94130 RepID=A0A8H3L420_9GLOM|nr:potassium voltage-gated channel protein Shaw-like [Rhizophagus clarus]
MSKNKVIFNVGGTKFEISEDLIKKYPNSELSSLYLSASFSKNEIFLDHNPLAFSVILDYLRYDKLLVPGNVAKEVIELQLREFRIPYDNIIEDDKEEDSLPSYASVIGEFSTPYKDYKNSLKDTVINNAVKRLDTLIQDVILPYLKRHAKRGHQQVTFYLTPNKEEVNDDEEDLPDIQFLLQSNNLKKLQDFILAKSGVKKVIAKQVEVSCRTENEFGLFSTKSFEIIQIDVIIV